MVDICPLNIKFPSRVVNSVLDSPPISLSDPCTHSEGFKLSNKLSSIGICLSKEFKANESLRTSEMCLTDLLRYPTKSVGRVFAVILTCAKLIFCGGRRPFQFSFAKNYLD